MDELWPIDANLIFSLFVTVIAGKNPPLPLASQGFFLNCNKHLTDSSA
jgi:hypothetical protein